MRGLLAIYLPTRREWAISENIVTLMYAALECDKFEGEYKLVWVDDGGRMHQSQNRWGTARWLASPKIKALETGKKMIVKDNLVTCSNLIYRINGRHLLPVSTETYINLR